MDSLDLNDNGPSNSKGYRYFLAVIDHFPKFRESFPLQNKNAQTMKISIENILMPQKENRIYLRLWKEICKSSFY